MKIDHYARGGFNVSYEERVSPAELRKQRIDKARAELKKQGWMLSLFGKMKTKDILQILDLR